MMTDVPLFACLRALHRDRSASALTGALVLFSPLAIGAASAQTLPAPSHNTVPAAAAPNRPAAASEADSGSRSVAARARMNECGHQWNNMKHAGTASGTWKEFSRGCLAQK
jgi:hypothetical protein